MAGLKGAKVKSEKLGVGSELIFDLQTESLDHHPIVGVITNNVVGNLSVGDNTNRDRGMNRISGSLKLY